MRSLLAAALAICLSLLAPTAVLARPEHRGCALEITPAASKIGAGEAATVTGLLTCQVPAEAAEQTVTIYQHTAGTNGSEPVGSVITDPTGAFQFSSEELNANSTFSARCDRARSRRAPVKVGSTVTLAGPSGPRILLSSHRANAAVVFSGVVTPSGLGARVVLQRESAKVPGNWRRIGTAAVAADGSYSIPHSFSISGMVTLRTVVRRHGQLAVASEALTYEVAHRQHPRLTIEASPALLTYGESVTVKGTVAGGVQTSVTLLARTRSGSPAPVEEIQTDPIGNYEFAPQTPLTTTWYTVTSSHLRSARVLETVKPQLTASLSSAAAHTGEVLTVSGSLTPAHSGQIVVLERLNPSGVAYHPVATLVMGEGSQYSFERLLTGSGKQIYRVKVPRDGDLSATASAPLEVDVTAPEAQPPPGEETPGAGGEA